jgi:hypothetical protein
VPLHARGRGAPLRDARARSHSDAPLEGRKTDRGFECQHRDSHVQVACLPTPRRCASAASAASAAEAVATSRTAGLDDDQSSRRRGPRPLHRRGRGPCESWCSSKSVSRCSSAAFRGKATAAAERPVHAHVRADDREQPARTRIACRGRSVGATGQRPLRGAVAISKAGVRGPDAGRVVRHDLDHANVPVLATARVVAARARLGRRRSAASPRAGSVSCRSVDRQADGDVEARSRRGRNYSARSAAQLEACVDASFLTARQFRRILREPRRDPRPAAWKATLAGVRGEHRRFQRRLPPDRACTTGRRRGIAQSFIFSLGNSRTPSSSWETNADHLSALRAA